MNAYDCDRPLVGTSSAKHWKTDKNQENQESRTFRNGADCARILGAGWIRVEGMREKDTTFQQRGDGDDIMIPPAGCCTAAPAAATADDSAETRDGVPRGVKSKVWQEIDVDAGGLHLDSAHTA